LDRTILLLCYVTLCHIAVQNHFFSFFNFVSPTHTRAFMSSSAVAAAVAAAAAEKKALLIKLQDREREIAELRRECKTASAQAKSAAALGEIHRTDLDKMRRTAEAMAAERTQAALAQRTTEREVVALRHELKRALLVQQHVLQQQLLSSADVSSPVPSPVPSPADGRPVR
jgi:hypothetical protein